LIAHEVRRQKLPGFLLPKRRAYRRIAAAAVNRRTILYGLDLGVGYSF